jgi:SAM-dependent methyltransferase
MSGVTVDREGTVTGNTYDKYGSTNPVVRRLMARFEGTLEELFTQADPQSLLDVGCGEGVLTHQWAQRLGDERRVVGIDLDDPALHAEWAKRTAPNLEYRRRDGPGGQALAARLGAARAAVARAEHGPRRVLEGPRQHARARQPLVQALVRGAALAPRRGRAGALAVPVDDAARPPS